MDLARRSAILFWKPSPLDVGERHVAGIGADVEHPQLLRLVGGLGRGPDGDVLARRELVVVFAEISLDWLLVGGFSRDETEAGETDRDGRKKSNCHGGHGVTSLTWGADDRTAVPSNLPARAYLMFPLI